MNFLALVQKTWVDSGQSGQITSVTGLSGHQARFVDYVKDAWIDIQQESNEWVFLKTSKICTLAASQELYDQSSIGVADVKTPLAVLISVSGQWVPLGLSISLASEFEEYRANKQSGMPAICYYSNGTFSFDTIPDADYSIKIHYRKKPQELAANADTPICDDTYHRTIVWLASRNYAADDQDQALYVRMNNAYEKALLSMLSDLTPPITFAPSAF